VALARAKGVSNMPKLQKFRDYHYESTAKVSDNTRTLALSAIALAWLFKSRVGDVFSIPEGLQLPLFFVITALTLDFFQFVYRAIIWHFLFRREEKKFGSDAFDEEVDLDVSPHVNALGYWFFYAKIPCIVIAYVYLLIFFMEKLEWIS